MNSYFWSLFGSKTVDTQFTLINVWMSLRYITKTLNYGLICSIMSWSDILIDMQIFIVWTWHEGKIFVAYKFCNQKWVIRFSQDPRFIVMQIIDFQWACQNNFVLFCWKWSCILLAKIRQCAPGFWGKTDCHKNAECKTPRNSFLKGGGLLFTRALVREEHVSFVRDIWTWDIWRSVNVRTAANTSWQLSSHGRDRFTQLRKVQEIT